MVAQRLCIGEEEVAGTRVGASRSVSCRRESHKSGKARFKRRGVCSVEVEGGVSEWRDLPRHAVPSKAYGSSGVR